MEWMAGRDLKPWSSPLLFLCCDIWRGCDVWTLEGALEGLSLVHVLPILRSSRRVVGR